MDDLIARNIERLAASVPEEHRPSQKLAKWVGKGTSNGTIDRLRKGKTSPRAETLAVIAPSFGLKAWQLLVDDLDPAHPPQLLTEEVKAEVKAEARAQLKEEIRAEVTRELTEEITARLKEQIKADLRTELRDEITAQLREEITAELITGLIGLNRRLPPSKQKPEEIEVHLVPLTPLLSSLFTPSLQHPQGPAHRPAHGEGHRKD
jgi:hypothetical protein